MMMVTGMVTNACQCPVRYMCVSSAGDHPSMHVIRITTMHMRVMTLHERAGMFIMMPIPSIQSLDL